MKELVKLFIENKNEDRARKMSDYMKNNFEFLGLDSSKRRELQKNFIKELIKGKEVNKVMVLQLWSYKEREFQYVALDYLLKCKKNLRKEDISLVETLILSKAWWDTVDILSAHLVGELVSKNPELIHEYIIPWSLSDNLWLRRTAILFQLKYKEQTNTELLSAIINRNSKDIDFFIRKAIGWALREYSKTDGQWVKAFINDNELSNLSKKEGLKLLDNI